MAPLRPVEVVLAILQLQKNNSLFFLRAGLFFNSYSLVAFKEQNSSASLSLSWGGFIFNVEAQTITSGGAIEQPTWCWLKNREEERTQRKGRNRGIPDCVFNFFCF